MPHCVGWLVGKPVVAWCPVAGSTMLHLGHGVLPVSALRVGGGFVGKPVVAWCPVAGSTMLHLAYPTACCPCLSAIVG